MRLTIHQPEHMPWLGLLAKIAASEVWVVLDSVPYRKNYFQNRNRVLVNGKQTWLTVPVTAPFGTLIRDIRVAETSHWQQRYLGRLQQAVPQNAPENLLGSIIDIIGSVEAGSLLLDLNLKLADWLLDQFGVVTPQIRSSGLGAQGQKSELIRNLCLKLDANEYLAGPSGRDYLDLPDFASCGIDVIFFDFEHPIYPQEGSFVPSLSAVDAWSHVSQPELPRLLSGYRLSTS